MVKKTGSPLFSILLPTHNREDVIGFSIVSVLGQTFENFELLITGDGCTDSTESIVRDFAGRDSRVKWFAFPKGPGFGYEHRNTVLASAAGHYIAFAAHDNLWFPDHLELFANFFRKNPDYIIAYTRPLWMHPDGTLIPSFFNLGNEKSRKVFFNSHNQIPAHCVVHTRGSGVQVGFYNPEVSEAGDWDLWKRILETDAERKIGFINTPSSVHFRASWRTEKNYMNGILYSAHARINSSSEFSRKLRVKERQGWPLQQSLWEVLSQDRNWPEEIRQSLAAFLDLLVHEGVELIPNLISDVERLKSEEEASGKPFQDLISEVERLTRENVALKDHIRIMEGTRGYKALQFARRLVRPFRKIN
jgi:glycosyltransferase involved in cell wall biosynthesis